MKDRPRIEIKPTGFDVVLDIIGAACVLIMVILPAIHYGSLPDDVPTKFGADGLPTSYSPKPLVWLLPFFGLITWVGMYVLNKYPHIFNYTVKITQENAHIQYQLATRFIRVLNTMIAVTFAYLTQEMIFTSLGEQTGIGAWFLPVFMLVMFGSIIFYLFAASTKK